MNYTEACVSFITRQTRLSRENYPFPTPEKESEEDGPSKKALLAGEIIRKGFGCERNRVFKLADLLLGEKIPRDEPETELGFNPSETKALPYSAMMIEDRDGERFVIFRYWDGELDLQLRKEDGDTGYITTIYSIRYATDEEITEQINDPDDCNYDLEPELALAGITFGNKEEETVEEPEEEETTD